MARISSSVVSGYVTVTFEFPASVWAGTIHVAGDFNDWSRTNTPLKQDQDGVWRATLDLPIDQVYEYYYLVDGTPQNIYTPQPTSSQHRSFNSVLHTALASTPHEQELPEVA